MNSLNRLFGDRIEMINLEVEKALRASEVKGRLYDAAVHAVEGGKRLRPLICLLSCDGVGGDSSKILPTAVGIELIHAFTLVHDDIIDGDELRRGRPSLRYLCGDNMAILTGDALFALAYKSIVSNCGAIGADRMVRVVELCSDACLKLARGQMMDIFMPLRNGWSDEIIKLKTAPLFSLASAVGALLGGGDGEEIERMGNYGQYLGMAFQIEDDLLNIMGDPERVGKPWGGDLRRGKSTLPIAYALRGLKELEIEKLLTSPEKELLALVKDSGSLEYSQKVARSLVESAKRNLKVVEGEEERAALELIADYAVGREE